MIASELCASLSGVLLATAGGGAHPVLWAALGVCALLIVIVGLLRVQRRPDADLGDAPPPVRARTQTLPPEVHAGLSDSGARGLATAVAALAKRLTAEEPEDDVWAALDQMIRETLGTSCGAARVRCFRVDHDAARLHPIAHAAHIASPDGHPLDGGLFGHVASTGREYVAGERGHGPLLDDLAAREPEPWVWIWPVRRTTQTIGLVAVGAVRDGMLPEATVRRGFGALLTLAWSLVCCRDVLRRAERTDPATGVLTRTDFFDAAQRALAASYGANEPVVIVALAIEGLRRLDDGQRWQLRDALLERVGQVVGERVRSDDLVGRFSDDRFVMLLRRLDTGLGTLIGEKLLAAATTAVTSLEEAGERVTLRLGIAGSGLGRPPLDDLLRRAFAGIDRARSDGTAVGKLADEGRAR